MKRFHTIAVAALLLLTTAGFAYATVIAPGQTCSTPNGNKVTNNGTGVVNADAFMVNGREQIECSGNNVKVELNAAMSDVTIDGNGNTVDHNAPDTTGYATGQPTTVHNAGTTTTTTNASNQRVTSSSR